MVLEFKCWLFFITSCTSIFVCFTEDSFYMTINSDIVIKFTSSNNMHEYKFNEQEGVNFACHTTLGNPVQLSRTTKAGNHSSTGAWTQSTSMYMKLRTVNNYDTVECKCYDQNNVINVIRLRLIVHKDIRGMFTFVVNGLILPRIKYIGDASYYEYKYYVGESLTVHVISEDHTYFEGTCGVSGTNKSYPYFRNKKTRLLNFAAFTLSEMETQMNLFCAATRKSDYKLYHITVTFLYHQPEYTPFIIGLSTSKVLIQYSNATGNIIEYDIGDDTLNLYCQYTSYNATHLLPSIWVVPFDRVSTSKELEVYPRPFKLHPNHDSATIQCKGHRTTYLILVQMKDASSTSQVTPTTRTTTSPLTSPTFITVTTSQTTPSDRATTSTPPSTTKDTTGTIWVIGLVVVLLLLVVAIVVWKASKYRKKVLLENNSSKENYQNLPEHGQGPMTTPPQWDPLDDAIYAEPNTIDNLYAKLTSKNQGTTLKSTEDTRVSNKKPTYSNIQQINNEPNYAVPNSVEYENLSLNNEDDKSTSDVHRDLEDTERPFSKEPKSHGQNTEGQHPNDLVYAEIYHKNADVVFNATEKSVYSEILH